MNNKLSVNMNLIEELAINAFPALQTQLYDGWILRFTNGITYRGNSVNPLYASNIDYNEKISVCEEKYISLGIPVSFKIKENSDKELDIILESKGYTCEAQTNVMICDIAEINYESSNIIIKREISDKWVNDIFRNSTDTRLKETYTAIHKNILSQKIYASIEQEGKMIANGVGIVERGFVGLFDIGVDENHRQKGLGYKICMVILNEARNLGADRAYIEVNALNNPAIQLYRKLGSKDLYKYWYRVKKHQYR